jgi:hypothetical protein
MLTRWFSGVAVLVAVWAAPVQAADDKSEPALVVQVRSLNALMETGKYLAGLAGQEEKAKQAEGIIKARIGQKGLEGIDAKMPFGLYAHELSIGRPPVAMIPVADQKAVLALLKAINFEPEEKDGLYTISRDELPVEIYFRFANDYAYVTAINAGDVDKDKLLDPAILKMASPQTLAAATLNIDRLPRTLKNLAIGQMESGLRKAQRHRPRHESEAEAHLRSEALKQLAAKIASVIREGAKATLQVEVDPKSHDLAVQMSLTGKSGSSLAENIASLGERKSLFGGLSSTEAAATGLVHFNLSESMRASLGQLIDHAAKKLETEERDEAKRELGGKLLKAIAPSVKAGQLDWFGTLRGPNKSKHYTGVFAIKVKEGKQIEKTVREIIDRVAPAREKAKIEYDADKVGEVAIHRVILKGKIDRKGKRVFGETDLYVAFRDDAFIASLGEEALEVIKEVISAQPKYAPVAQVQVSLARLLPLIALAPRGDKIAPAAAKVLEDAKDGGKIRFTVEGGKALKARFSVTALAIKFFAIARQRQAEPVEGEAEPDNQAARFRDRAKGLTQERVQQAQKEAQRAYDEAVKIQKELEKPQKSPRK